MDHPDSVTPEVFTAKTKEGLEAQKVPPNRPSFVSSTLSWFIGIPHLMGNLIGIAKNHESSSSNEITPSTPQEGANQNQHNILRLQMFKLAKALESQRDNTNQTLTWFNKAIDYWNGELPDQIRLTPEQELLLESLRNQPIFHSLKAELKNLSKFHKWLSLDANIKSNYDTRQKMQALDDFVREANYVLDKIEKTKQALLGKVDNVDRVLDDLINQLSFDHFIIALDALSNKQLLQVFDFNEVIAALPDFAVAVCENKDLLQTRPVLVSLFQTTSLGMMQTFKNQLQMARKLSQFEDAESKLLALIYEPVSRPIPEIQSIRLHERYMSSVNNYIGYIYDKKFWDGITEESLSMIVNQMPTTLLGNHTYFDGIYVEECKEFLRTEKHFSEFRTSLQKLGLTEVQRRAVYQNILQSLLSKKYWPDRHKKPEPDVNPSRNILDPLSWFDWSIFNSTNSEKPSSSIRQEDTDSSDQSQSVCLPEFDLPSIESVSLQTLESDGEEAFIVAKTIKRMILKDPDVFGGRNWSRLTVQDMIKVCTRIDEIRLSAITSAEDLSLVNRYKQELAALVQAEHADSIVWTYQSLLAQLRQKALDAINTVQNPTPLGSHKIITDYVSTRSTAISSPTKSENDETKSEKEL